MFRLHPNLWALLAELLGKNFGLTSGSPGIAWATLLDLGVTTSLSHQYAIPMVGPHELSGTKSGPVSTCPTAAWQPQGVRSNWGSATKQAGMCRSWPSLSCSFSLSLSAGPSADSEVNYTSEVPSPFHYRVALWNLDEEVKGMAWTKSRIVRSSLMCLAPWTFFYSSIFTSLH